MTLICRLNHDRLAAWPPRCDLRRVTAVVAFVAFSICCGLSRSMGALVLFRILQGLAGGPLIPQETADWSGNWSSDTLSVDLPTAFFAGRDFILPADVKRIAPDALRHRLIRTVRAEAENVSADEIVEELLAKVAIP